MIDQLFAIHQEVIANIPLENTRYLLPQINWASQAICLVGSRGVGKTTLMCQHLISQYPTVNKGLYISADNVHVLSQGLFDIVSEYFKYGGEAIFIDEVHKYPSWSIEIKNIIDTFKKQKIIFSASSSLELHKSKGDLSRRVIYYNLYGLSFREFLKLNYHIDIPTYTLEQILKNHIQIAGQFKGLQILKYFTEYLVFGYFPFFLEGTQEYLSKMNNVIEKTIFEDIAVAYNLRQNTLITLKKILWLVATSKGLIPNIDKISKNLAMSREIIYDCFEYLARAGLLNNIYSDGTGMKLVRKPAKVYLENTNLMYAINGSLKLESDIGTCRETFFVNQLAHHSLKLHDFGDFIVNNQYVFEIGGQGKTSRQIKNLDEAFLVIDNLEIGYGNKIPLFLFGLMY